MPAPSNTTLSTATAIPSLPYTITQDTFFGGTYYTVWFAYTAVAGDVELSIFPWGDANALPGSYRPECRVYLSQTDFTNLRQYAASTGGTALNKAKQIPVLPGTTYYIQIVNNHTSSAFANTILTLSVLSHQTADAPVGSLLVNDDITRQTSDTLTNYPAALLSATTGQPLRFHHPFPAGETADVLPTSGLILVHDRFNDHLKLYSNQLVLLSDLAWGATTGARYPIRSNKLNRFYVAKPSEVTAGNKAVFVSVSAAGVFEPTTWGPLSAAGCVAIGPSPDETILYHVGEGITASTTTGQTGGAVNAPIKRWNLVSNVALTDLAASPGATWCCTPGSLLVLNDGTILTGYVGTSLATAPIVRRYDPSGALLQTYTFTGARSHDLRMAYAIDDPLSFWVWTKFPPTGAINGISRFSNVRVSDGAVLSFVEGHQYEDGVYVGVITATPDRFGHSESCPFLVLRAAIPPVSLPLPACVHACLVVPDVISGGGQSCLLTLDLPTGGGQACRPPAAPDVECT